MAEIFFHDLATGGDGVGKREDGKTVFAPFALPGERALVEIGEEKASFARGQIVEILERSPHRIAPPCPFFRPDEPEKSCGGCTWQHLELGAQREAKRKIVRELLERIGGQKIELDIEGDAGFGYRNKAVFQVQNQEIGFHKHASHELISIDHCPIQRAENSEVLEALQSVISSDTQFSSAFTQILVRVSTSGERVVGLYSENFERAEQFATQLREQVELKGIFWRHSEPGRPQRGKTKDICGQTRLIEEVNGLLFEIDGEGFWQVNSQMTPRMAQVALEFAGDIRGKKLLDLYCGAGLFALHFARAGAKVWGVELSAEAIENAKKNSTKNSRMFAAQPNFTTGDAAKIARTFAPGFFETIVLDPPRAGAKEAIPALLRLAPRQIIYVSCDPATLARDVKSLTPHYRIARARAFDLFPQTPHVETILLLEKSGEQRKI